MKRVSKIVVFGSVAIAAYGFGIARRNPPTANATTAAAMRRSYAVTSLGSATAQTTPAPNDLAGTATAGRFQMFHIYYSTVQQGTGMIDSNTGQVWLLSEVTQNGKVTGETALFEVRKFGQPAN